MPAQARRCLPERFFQVEGFKINWHDLLPRIAVESIQATFNEDAPVDRMMVGSGIEFSPSLGI